MRRREYTTLTIVISVLEAVAVVAIVLWLLPQWGIKIPVWGLILIMLAFGIYQGVTYRLGRRALCRKPVVSLEAMVGRYGEATTPLTPDGYVQLDGELWRGLSTGPNIHEGDKIVVVEVKGLTLFVDPLPNNMK